MKRKVLALLAAASLVLTACGGNQRINIPVPKTDEEIKASAEDAWEMTIDTQIPEELQAQPHPAADSFAGGTGTEEDPYQIATADQLARLAELVNQDQFGENGEEVKAAAAASYVLTADIDMNDLTDFDTWTEQAPEYLWIPVGVRYDYTLTDTSQAELLTDFKGHFDGQGHTIRGLYIVSAYYNTEASQQPYYGLFGLVDGVVENVTVTDSLYRFLTPAELHPVGGIVANVNSGSRVENCTSSVDIVAQAATGIGGVAGDISGGELRGCTFDGSIRTEGKIYYAGGIVSEGSGGTIAQCTAKGSFKFTQEPVLALGGVAGELMDNTEGGLLLEDCVNEMDLNGAGIVGNLASFHDGITLRGCMNKGTVKSGGIAAGLSVHQDQSTGTASTMLVENCVNEGTVQGEGNQGGIAAEVNLYDAGTSLTVTGCRNEGTVTSTDGAAGIFAALNLRNASTAQITGCENTGSVSSTGYCAGGVISNLFVQNDVTGTDVLIQNCRNSGQVNGGNYGAAGILAREMGALGTSVAGNTVRLDGCENAGTVTGLMPIVYAGGIAGYLPFDGGSTTVTGCSNTGTVQMLCDGPIDRPDDGRNYPQGVIAGIVACTEESVKVQDCTNTGSIDIPQDIADITYTDDLVGCTFAYDGTEPVLGMFQIQDGKAIF